MVPFATENTVPDFLRIRLHPDIKASIGNIENPDGIIAVLDKRIIPKLKRMIHRKQKSLLAAKPNKIDQLDPYFHWIRCIQYLLSSGHSHMALICATKFYEGLSNIENELGYRIHKGEILFTISRIYDGFGYRSHANRYMLMALCEDAQSFLNDDNTVKQDYWRFAATRRVLRDVCGLSKTQIIELLISIRDRGSKTATYGNSPEFLSSIFGSINEICYDRLFVIPTSTEEYCHYHSDPLYLNKLLEIVRLGDRTGKAFEHIATFLLASIPGCRVRHDVSNKQNQNDIIGALDGTPPDFRSELGRYFIAECKDYSKRTQVSVMQSFLGKMSTTDVNFGILFTKSGLTGSSNNRHASRANDRSKSIVVIITLEDIESIAHNHGFLNLLRRKYESQRFDMQ